MCGGIDTGYGDLPCGCDGRCECGAEVVEVGDLTETVEAGCAQADFPNLKALAQGCVSGSISEWPALRLEARAALERIAALESDLAAALEAGQGMMARLREKLERIAALEAQLARAVMFEAFAQAIFENKGMCPEGHAPGSASCGLGQACFAGSDGGCLIEDWVKE